MKHHFFVYEDFECLIEKTDGEKYNPQNLYTTKVGEHIPSGFSISTISSLKSIGHKHNKYRGEDCMKGFCEYLKEHVMEMIAFKKENGSC